VKAFELKPFRTNVDQEPNFNIVGLSDETRIFSVVKRRTPFVKLRQAG
jgi:hypothetical protein